MPSSYIKNPRGSKKAAIATDRQKGRGAWPSKKIKDYGNRIIYK